MVIDPLLIKEIPERVLAICEAPLTSYASRVVWQQCWSSGQALTLSLLQSVPGFPGWSEEQWGR
uniref:Uncharacterized protein n=1 Tax=Thermosporothrix sp. COM3 TaxID=2490863 RepID=A0A455SJY4_9CHLR|nr:hypothetical protein KTC_12060 [Thermosporothrix sp. COM3]